MTQVIDEWEHVFAKDVNLILLKCFMRFVQANGKYWQLEHVYQYFMGFLFLK